MKLPPIYVQSARFYGKGMGNMSDKFGNILDKSADISDMLANISDKSANISDMSANISDMLAKMSDMFAKISDLLEKTAVYLACVRTMVVRLVEQEHIAAFLARYQELIHLGTRRVRVGIG